MKILKIANNVIASLSLLCSPLRRTKFTRLGGQSQFLTIFIIILFSFSLASAYSGGTGEPNSPYQIGTVPDWQTLMTTTADWNKQFILIADVNLQGVALTPVGNPTNQFTGIFEGNGHVISNMTINTNENKYIGLFGYTDQNSIIRNLGIKDVNVVGKDYVGGLVGLNYGSINNCYSTGVVSGYYQVGGLVGSNGGIISDCYSMGAVSSDYWVGGLVGENSGSISDCYSTGSVSGNGRVGGLVGFNGGSINNCYSMGAVSGDEDVGGLVGQNCSGSIVNCYSTGSVSGESGIGGLVGLINYGSITNCYSTDAVNGSSRVGGLVGYKIGGGNTLGSFWDTQTSGQMTSAGGTGKTTEQMQDINTFLNIGWDFINETANGTCNYWQMPAGGGYLVLSTFNGYIPPEPSGSGTENDPYVITDANDLGTMWYRPTSYYKLSNDIDLAGIEWSTAVVPVLSGALDGNGFCIENLSIISGASNLGLFGWISSGGEVKNLGLENCAVSGDSDIGGLVGYNEGTISNCSSMGSVSGDYEVGGLVGENYGGSISNCYSTGAVSGGNVVGGLVGWNYDGSISNCYSTGAVSGSSGVGGLVGLNYDTISDCYSTGAVSGSSGVVGGLVGLNSDTISDCYSTGAVSGSSNVGGLVGDNGNGSISNCYSTGVVIGSSYHVGGLVGINNGGGIINNCYSTGVVSGTSSVGGLVGEYFGDDPGGSSISNCYSTGEVSGTSEVGGLVGSNWGSIINCYSTGAVVGDSNVGGLVGSNLYGGSTSISFWDIKTSGNTTSAGGTGKTTAEMKTRSTFTDAGWDFIDTWNVGENQTYPFFRTGPLGDLNYDGIVNFLDYALFADNWLKVN